MLFTKWHHSKARETYTFWLGILFSPFCGAILTLMLWNSHLPQSAFIAEVILILAIIAKWLYWLLRESHDTTYPIKDKPVTRLIQLTAVLTVLANFVPYLVRK